MQSKSQWILLPNVMAVWCCGFFYPMLQADRSHGSYYSVGRHTGAVEPTTMGWRIGVVDPSTQCSKQIGAADPTT
jgi:hypothetical protein